MNLAVLASRQPAPRAYEIRHELGQITDENCLNITAHYGDLSQPPIAVAAMILLAGYSGEVFLNPESRGRILLHDDLSGLFFVR